MEYGNMAVWGPTEAGTGRGLECELGGLFGTADVSPQLVGGDLGLVRYSRLWVRSLTLHVIFIWPSNMFRAQTAFMHMYVWLSCDYHMSLVTKKRDNTFCWILVFSSTESGRSTATPRQGITTNTHTYTYTHTQTVHIYWVYTAPEHVLHTAHVSTE